MKFYVRMPGERFPKNVEFPCFIVEKDTWEDFGYQTLFSLKYYASRRDLRTIGEVKIMEEGKNITELPPTFTSLGEQFCSLGQTSDYYKNLQNLGSNYRNYLWPLRDVTSNAEIYSRYKDTRAFEKSLLRFSEANTTLREGIAAFSPEYNHRIPFAALERISFTFYTSLKRAKQPHSIDFIFGASKTLCKRINVIIGKNGTGKTQYLTRLANSLSGWKPEDGYFEPERPYFRRVLAISYSPFDDFEKPSIHEVDRRTFSYKYCGIRDETDKIDIDGLKIKLKQNLAYIFKGPETIHGRDQTLMGLLLGFTPRLLGGVIDYKQPLTTLFNKLSSGQRVLLFIMTDILYNIENNSLIIFDEPENHFHPNILAELILFLRAVLEQYDSYAIIATHSALIVQDVPSECVHRLQREDNITTAMPLQIESFGENLTTLTEEIFESSSSEANWSKTLKDMAAKLAYEEALAYFKKPLSLNGKIFLKSQYRTKKPK